MSRICVKNIGKNTNEKQIRELFSSKGEVTDVKVITSKDGKSRRFAFVGFRTDVQASEAQKHFNNTFIGMSRIVVDMAKKFNDQSLKENKQKFAKKGKQHSAKANESDSEGDSDVESPQKAAKKPTKDESFTSIDPNSVAGRKKAEFLEMMKPRRNTNKWANDDVAGGVSLDPSRQPVPVSAQDSDSDSERMAVDAADSSSDDDSSVDNFADAEPGAGAGDSSKPISDLDYLRSKIRCKRADSAFSSSDSDSERSDDGSSSGSEGDGEGERSDPDDSAQPSHSNRNNTGKTNTGKNKDEKATAKHTKDTDNNSEQGDDAAVPENDETEIEDARLFVKNLPFSCTEEEFKSLFSAFGPISELHLPLDEEKRGKGYGFVQYMLPEHADAALDALASEAFQGRVLYIVKAQRPKEKDSAAQIAAHALKGNKAKLSSFQLKKEEERRKFVNRKEGWNAAFVRSDAVVDSLAARHGMSSADILDTTKSGGEMAVRLAIGESQIVGENRSYFASHGVDIDILESTHSTNKAAARSTTTLLVKNLPASAVPDELESMFARYGSIAAFLAPPSKTMVLVDFVEPSEARTAQKGLAYRSYKHSPLYLEWAPVNAIDRKKKPVNAAATATAGANDKASKDSKTTTATSSSTNKSTSSSNVTADNSNNTDNNDNGHEYSSLFIKNLNFSTTETNLQDHLLHLGVEGLRKVQIQKKQKGSHMLSQGYGFAEFRTPELAARALARMSGSLLDSHALEVKPSDKRLTVAPAAAAKSSAASNGANNTNNKLIVRNVAFQATKSEIRDLFASYGSVKRVRIPKKMGGEHRGFAFVDFSTAQEAALAMASLKNTHLYGRHLVLEWAKEDEENGNLSELYNAAGLPGGANQMVGMTGGASQEMQRLRKKARSDEMVINMQSKRAKVQDILEGSMGGIGSDDV